MKRILLLFMTISTVMAHPVFAQTPKVITTGPNLIDSTDASVADVVIGSNLSGGTRHDASIMWFSNTSASRISNTADVFYLSQWRTTNPNIGLAATVGGNSFFLGNVGIGTTAPNQKLNIRTNNKNGLGISGNTNTFIGGDVVLTRVNSSPLVGRSPSIYFGDESIQNAASIIQSYHGNLQFFNAINGISSEYMRIADNGNVGIGITTPDSKLAVNGTIHSKEVKIDLNGWSDYVFKIGYRLKPLNEVKAYIDQNQHLPEIPSEQEMIRSGLNVSEMNKLLMKKVEELTLYLVEEHRHNNALEVQLEKQQAAINELQIQQKTLHSSRLRQVERTHVHLKK